MTIVAPIGLRDRGAGTVSVHDLARLRPQARPDSTNSKVALAYHAREHGFAGGNERFVLVQGNASFDAQPERDVLENKIGPQSERFMGKPRRGRFWDRWLRGLLLRPRDRDGRGRADRGVAGSALCG